jgi:hypothetical protein
LTARFLPLRLDEIAMCLIGASGVVGKTRSERPEIWLRALNKTSLPQKRKEIHEKHVAKSLVFLGGFISFRYSKITDIFTRVRHYIHLSYSFVYYDYLRIF